ncbi:MAG: redoxin domain-containing protein [Myxococcales bacterium]|nr:redoxin domain-containing protein [Myxococcales bacterium]
MRRASLLILLVSMLRAQSGQAAGAAEPAAVPVPAAAVVAVQPELARPWIGIGIEKGSAGVRVTSIIPGAPAEQAGLLVGDEVLRFGGVVVTEPGALIARVREQGVGARVELALLRAGVAVVVPLTLVARPDDLEQLRERLLGKAAQPFSVMPAWNGTGTARKKRQGVTLRQLIGKVVVVEFFATWCGPCRASMPTLSAWQRAYGKRGLRVLGLSSETAEVIAEFGATERPSYQLLVDERGVAAESYLVPAVPTLVVIDRRGVVRHVEVGGGAALTRIEATLRALLKE